MMKYSFLLILALFQIRSAHAQCDSLMKLNNPPEGFMFNSQSHIQLLSSSDDFELCVVLSPDKQYEFHLSGNRYFEVYLKSNLSYNEDQEDKMTKKIILTQREEEDRIFRIQPDHVQRIYIRLFGVIEEGEECVGVNVFEKK